MKPRYTSKAYRAYVSRSYLAFYGRPWSSSFESMVSLDDHRKLMMTSLSEVMSDMVTEYASRSGFFRSYLASDEERANAIKERNQRLAEIKARQEAREAKDAVFEALLLPYSRYIDYTTKCVPIGYITNASSVPYAKYDNNFVEPTHPFPEAT